MMEFLKSMMTIKDDNLRFHLSFKGINGRNIMKSVEELCPILFGNLSDNLTLNDDSKIFFKDSSWTFEIKNKELRDLCNKEDIEVQVICLWGDEHRTIKDMSRTMFQWFKKKEEKEY